MHKNIILITALASLSFTNTCIAEKIIIPITLDSDFPAKLIASEFNIDTRYQFESINSVCITGSIKSGNATSINTSVAQEPSPFRPSLGIIFPTLLTYKEGEPNKPYPEQLKICENHISPSNFLDSNGKFSLAAVGGHVEFWNLNLEIEGTISPTQVQLTIDESVEFSVPFYGGKVRYDAKIQNLDGSEGQRTLKQWSVIHFPNGDSLPVHKMREYRLAYTEEKLFNRNYINIPSWFESGEYRLTWYVADPETGTRIKDSIQFTKD